MKDYKKIMNNSIHMVNNYIETRKIMQEIILDTVLDTLKILPFLFIAFLIIEFFEHKLSKKTETWNKKKECIRYLWR